MNNVGDAVGKKASQMESGIHHDDRWVSSIGSGRETELPAKVHDRKLQSAQCGGACEPIRASSRILRYQFVRRKNPFHAFRIDGELMAAHAKPEILAAAKFFHTTCIDGGAVRA